MGSGLSHSAQKRYVGTGADQSLTFGFQPKVVKVFSTGGVIHKQEGMPTPFKQTAAGAASLLAADDLVLDELGVTIKGTDAALNAVSTEYYLEAYS